MSQTDPHRCAWCPDGDAHYQSYHDREWGVPSADERHLFEMLILEGAQAGLSWATILHKRDGYRRAFDRFDAERIAAYEPSRLDRLREDPGIVRNRLKIAATVNNARCYLELRANRGGLAPFLWGFVDGRPLQNQWSEISKVPASTSLSDKLSVELRRLGFKFVGSTICYAYMQAIGMVNDHTLDCFRHRELKDLAEDFQPL